MLPTDDTLKVASAKSAEVKAFFELLS